MGIETGELVLRDWDTFGSLLRTSADDGEAAASVAGLVYRKARSEGRLAEFPELYSRAVGLALDPDFADLRRGGSEPPPAPSTVRVSRRQDVKAPAILRKAWEKLVSSGQSTALAAVQLEAVRAPLVSSFKPGETVRVHVGIDKAVPESVLRAEGLSSRHARRRGAASVAPTLGRIGRRRAVLEHLRGDYRDSLFVDSSLSPRVAESFAGEGVVVVSADVPLEQVVFANDPWVWSGTAFESSGNPNDYLHEAILPRIDPAWIVGVRRVTAVSWSPSRGKKAGAVAEAFGRPVIERLRR